MMDNGRGSIEPATPRALNEALSARKPGQTTTLKISRNNTSLEVQVTLNRNKKLTFRLGQAPAPTARQKVVLTDWLRHRP